MMTTMATPTSVHTMVGGANVELALKCLGSVRTLTRHPISIVAHEDGTLGDDARRLLSGVVDRIVDRAEADALVEPLLRGYPRCEAFRRNNLFGLKLLDIPLLEQVRVIYIDTDILFTRPLKCPDYFVESLAPFVAMKDLKNSYAVRLRQWPQLWRLGVQLAANVCAGMLSYSKSAYDLDYVEWLLEQDSREGLFGGFPFWAEQTIFAALAGRAGCSWIEPGECVIAHPSQFPLRRVPAVMHFAGFSRRHFAGVHAGVDFASEADPIGLGVVRAARCGLVRRVETAVRSRWVYAIPAAERVK